jgi:dTMP kinase
LERESLSFHERVRHSFLDLSASDPKRYLVLDATRPVDDLAGEVLDRVIPMLPQVPGQASRAVSESGLRSMVDRQLERRP